MQITGLSAYKEGVEDLLADVVKKSRFKSGSDPEYRVGHLLYMSHVAHDSPALLQVVHLAEQPRHLPAGVCEQQRIPQSCGGMKLRLPGVHMKLRTSGDA